MGCCVSSDESFDYERELRKQTVLQGVEKKNGEWAGDTSQLSSVVGARVQCVYQRDPPPLLRCVTPPVSAADLEAKGCSPIIVNATQPDLIRYPFDGKTVAERCGTIWHAFQRSVRNHPARMCLGARKRNPQGVVRLACVCWLVCASVLTSRLACLHCVQGIGPYTWLNYKETDAEVRQLACALGSIGLKKVPFVWVGPWLRCARTNKQQRH